MYHPYFRGKQNELITVRESAALMAASNFVPIIEPVKENLNGLKRALDAVVEVSGSAIVIVNPFHGYFSEDGGGLSALLAEHFKENDGISACVLLKNQMSVKDVLAFCEVHTDHPLTFIHAGFTDARGLVDALGKQTNDILHCFFEADSGKLYQKHFGTANKVLVRDGFIRRVSREYPEVEFFSDLHETYELEGMNGFGDFLIVGDDYSESGGPAYAVAIHLTFIDGDKDDVMYIYHFVSDRQDTPKDPAGKFLEALNKLIDKVDEPTSKVLETEAVKEFRELHQRRHYPGLGYLKKLSMQHHVETLANHFSG